MAEVIGKGCTCIYPFEKHYVNLALEKLIKENKEELSKIEKEWEEGKYKQLEKAGMADFERLTYPLKRFIWDMETVKERFAATPDCKDT